MFSPRIQAPIFASLVQILSLSFFILPRVGTVPWFNLSSPCRIVNIFGYILRHFKLFLNQKFMPPPEHQNRAFLFQD
ncbi:MAG: hypothetical protein FD153_486 [Rhodospirillaceae bacterium]|nr:MAG: hypothetical protein FD153_486 [Rhodospirillaceae bacterium]